MRKIHRRLLSGLLSAALTLSLLPPPAAQAAETVTQDVTGSITTTLRIDYEQSLEELRSRNIEATIWRSSGNPLGTVKLAEPGTQTLGDGFSAVVTARGKDGGELGGGNYPGYLDVSVDGLPLGAYTIGLSGTGFAPCQETVEMSDYAIHLIMGTGDASFSLGDVNGDGKVNQKDRQALSDALGSENVRDVQTFDLNGDGKINIVDLAYVNHQIGTEGQPQTLKTAALNPIGMLDTSRINQELESSGTKIATEKNDADLSDLFNSEKTVYFSNSSGSVEVPLTFQNPTDLEEVEIVTPLGNDAVTSGEVLVEYDENGTSKTKTVTFDTTTPVGTHAISRTPGSNVITVNLGTRVAVKKITIKVDKTESGFAAIETIRFLQDIVPENPAPLNSVVKRISAKAGNKQVDLSWDPLPNVSGYQVTYWPQGSPGSTKTISTEAASARAAGLENFKTYVFTVTPVDGGWVGKPSEPVSATPQPSSAPPKIDMVKVSELDGALRVTWKAAENSTYFKVFYQEKGANQWTQAGGELAQPQALIDGLTNGVTYLVYVLAGNEIGEGPRSDIAEGTPTAVMFERPEGIPTNGILDSSKIESVRLVDAGNYNPNEYTSAKPFDIKNVIDGDYSTHWTAQNWHRNEHVEVTFKEPVDLSGVIWVPRLDGAYPSYLRAYSIQVWYDGDDLSAKAGNLLVPHPNTGGVDRGAVGNDSDMHTWPAVHGSPAQSKFAILPMETAQKVKKISVAVEQRDYYIVSLSELLFMEYDPAHNLSDDIGRLFAGDIHTKLASGVTQEQINTLKSRLANQEERDYCLYPEVLEDELKLAEELLGGKNSSGVILQGLDARNSNGGSDLQPLGVTSAANKQITIYASGIPDGQKVNVVATQFNSEVSGWKSTIGPITNGRNVLKVPQLTSTSGKDRGGSLYVTYDGPSADQISLHIRRAADIPMLDLSHWYDLSEKARKEAIGAYVDELAAYVGSQNIANDQNDHRNVTEIATPTVLLSLPAKAVRNAIGVNSTAEEQVNTIYNTILAWEDIMHICKKTHGIDGTYEHNTMTGRQNIRCMTMFQGAFMYAAGNHIGIGYGSCGGMMTGKPISLLPDNASANSLFGWGIAHEIGHNMDMLGKAEITNNIYSLMVQTYDGKKNTLPSRLEKSNKYQGIFTKTAQQHPGASNDVFVQLGMYWQLHLAYDGADDPMGFYNKFSKAWQNKTYTEGAESYDEKVALTASGVAGKDLTEFFTRWGMTLSESVKAALSKYEKEERAVWYLSDQSRREMLNKTGRASGKITAVAERANGSSEENQRQIVISIDASGVTGSVQGYEISRNGKSIAFVLADQNKPKATYTDTIGSGNHRSYVYTVTAYDIQGFRIGEAANTGEVRIAYDMVVSPDAYVITRNGTGKDVTITLKKETAVTGLKLKDAVPKDGAYEVNITYTAGENTKTVTALTGTFGESSNQAIDDTGSYVAYFKYPGAGGDDTRIWTYDAETVVIKGIPDTVKENQIQLISYAGDDVAFLDGAAMGLLSEDYQYGEGAEDVLKAGTLVMIGTYRSDPVFSTFEIEGEFTGTVMSETEDGITETASVRRPMDGDVYLFATVPAFGDMCDISDGIFLFVPNVQREAGLQDMEKDGTHCEVANLLPSRMRVNLYRTDDPESAASKRLTAQSMWMECPGGTDLPAVVLQQAMAAEKGEN